ncbi:MAG: hypothetical protein WCY70_09010, partial [Methanoculleus sp.]
HDIRMCLTELVELENRPDPASTSSKKSENRNRALSKPDNEKFQLNPPRLIISYILEHYHDIYPGVTPPPGTFLLERVKIPVS